jgi:acetyl-CoA C-acetyltransferase
VNDAYRRAGVAGAAAMDGFEVHDCFSVTGYVLLDHVGITAPGEAWKAVEDGRLARVNPGGGLIGGGHPVGATGVRMVLDAARQVTGTAGATQLDDARTVATLNLGGSATTAVAFVVGQETLG